MDTIRVLRSFNLDFNPKLTASDRPDNLSGEKSLSLAATLPLIQISDKISFSNTGFSSTNFKYKLSSGGFFMLASILLQAWEC